MIENQKKPRILDECIEYCPLQVLYTTLDMEDCEGMCRQYMDKNSVQPQKCYLSQKEEYNIMYV